MQEFTAHNIRLANGRETLPSRGALLEEEPWFSSAVRALRALFPTFEGVRLVDLGCCEGGYSVGFARLGMEVLGIEVRPSNFAACQYVKDNVELANLNFVKDDVWNLARYGEFDAVFCCGLLYHLDRPQEFLKLVSANCRRAALFNTHFAPRGKTDRFSLSPVCEHEGLQGRWYAEFPEGDAGRDDMRWASWNNSRSFWLLREHLAKAIAQAGFPLVFEQLDFLGDVPATTEREYHATHHRCMFVGVKP